MGIDPSKFEEGLKKPKVVERIGALERKFQGVKLIVGIDRLDYIKGIPQKLHAFELFLTEHPEWQGKVVLVQIAVPSRQDVEEYQNLRTVVNELVGRINGKFGSVVKIIVSHPEMLTSQEQSSLCRSILCTSRCRLTNCSLCMQFPMSASFLRLVMA